MQTAAMASPAVNVRHSPSRGMTTRTSTPWAKTNRTPTHANEMPTAAAPHSNRYAVNKTQFASSIRSANCARTNTVRSVATVGYRVTMRNAPTGLASLSLKGRRWRRSSDSGSRKYANAPAMKQTAAAAKKGTRAPYSPRMPPNSGPATKPTPNATPISPKLCARLSGGVISAM